MLINSVFPFTTDNVTVWNVKRVARNDLPTINYHLILQNTAAECFGDSLLSAFILHLLKSLHFHVKTEKRVDGETWLWISSCDVALCDLCLN